MADVDVKPTRIIDYNRGVLINVHQATGMDVYMYVDTPGVYLNGHGKPVAEAMAKEAGYPTEEYAKRRQRQERLAAAKEKIEQEFALEVGIHKVVREKLGFKLVDIGLERFNVEDPEGVVLHKSPLNKAVAEKLLDHLTVAPSPQQPEKVATK